MNLKDLAAAVLVWLPAVTVVFATAGIAAIIWNELATAGYQLHYLEVLAGLVALLALRFGVERGN